MNALRQYMEDHDFVKEASSYGGEYTGACPFCRNAPIKPDGERSNRFHIWPDYNGRLPCRNGSGRYYCRVCGKNGDGVSFLIEHENKSVRDAMSACGLHMPEKWLAASPKTLPSTAPAKHDSPSSVVDAGRWRDAAAVVISAAEARMVPGSPGWEYALGRGFTPEGIRRYRLGYSPCWCKVPRDRWGLSSGGGRDDFWLGGPGLLIPAFDRFGRPHKVKVRIFKPKPDKPKYLNVPGSGQTLSTVRRLSLPCVLVEGELDALLLDQEAGDLVGCIAMGGSSSSLDVDSRDVLRKVPLVLDALDNDQGGDRLRSLALPHCPNGMRPLGLPKRYKDPGEALVAGVDLRGLVWDALEREKALPDGAVRIRERQAAEAADVPGPAPAPCPAPAVGPPLDAYAEDADAMSRAPAPRPSMGAELQAGQAPTVHALAPQPALERERVDAGTVGQGRQAPAPAPVPEAPRPLPARDVPPAPERRVAYVSRLVHDSLEAYRSAPPSVREALDVLVLQPGFFRLDRNVWSKAVGAWTLDGEPCAAGNAYLARHPELAEWTLSLGARCWQPWEASQCWFTPEELRGLGVEYVPDGTEDLPPALRHRGRF